MCSTVCEKAITDSKCEGRHGAAEDEQKATTGKSVCASTAFKIFPEPTADLICYVAVSEQNTHASSSSIAANVRDRLRRSTTKNFEGREYITRPTLLQVVSKDVVHCLFQQNMLALTHSEMAKRIPVVSRGDFVGYIDTEAKVLLALCVFVDTSMRTFLKLLEAGISDSSLPLTEECPTGVDKATLVRIIEIQWIFLPYDLFARPGLVVLPEDPIVPLIFDKKRDLVGSGAYSDVFRVILDNGSCSPLTTPEKASIYAVKNFKDENPYIEQSFKREYLVLQELAKIPHDHILLHLAAWSQGGIFYMIFPQAKCNLRTFMEEVECPGLAAENVVWFFKQLRGLADAVRHMHALKPLPALYRYLEYRRMAESDQAVVHNDIKPENILVFDSKDGFPSVFKISDFGCGKVVTKDGGSPQQNTERFYGTPEYESPDLVRHKEASKPNDVWALGCVFLELLDWFTLPKTDEQRSFLSQRYTGPGPTTAAFWYRDPGKYVQFQLKSSVGKKLVELENKTCMFKRGFEHMLLILWGLLNVDMENRWTAERVYSDMNHMTRQAMIDLSKDPDYYLRPGNPEGSRHLPIAAFPPHTGHESQAIISQASEPNPIDIRSKRADVNDEISRFKGNKPAFLAKRLIPEPYTPVWRLEGPIDPEKKFARMWKHFRETGYSSP